jgi:signal transduction histidine kinase
MASEDEADLTRLQQTMLGLGRDPRLSELVDLVAALVARSQRRELWLRASHGITQTLLTSTNLADTLRMVVERARQLADVPVAAIALPDPDQPGNLVFEVVDGKGLDINKVIGVSVPISDTGTGHVFRTGRSRVFSQYGLHIQSHWNDPGKEIPRRVRELDSMLAVPLAVGDQVRGVLVLARRSGNQPFADTDVRLAEAFAAQAALALEISRAEEDRRRLAVLSDRDRIARDLHDLVIQRLFAVGMALQAIGRTSATPNLAESIAGLVAELDRTIRDVRHSIFELHEATEEMAGLRAELALTVKDASAALGFTPRVDFTGPLDSLVSDQVRPDLLASLRESLSNAARHAVATEITVEVSVDRAGRLLTLVVTDNGVGMSADVGRRSGLANLGERARRWGGRLDLERPRDGGTRLRWTVPLAPAGPTAPSDVSRSER